MLPKEQNPHPPPPNWPDKLLERFCAPHLLEEVMGDLHERYYLRVQKMGVAGARKKYWREALAYARLSVFKRKSSNYPTPILTEMIRNNFIVALRKIARGKAFSVINISGLALGMTCFLLIFLWINDERSIDNFHKNGENLYNIYQTARFNGLVDGAFKTPVAFAEGQRYLLLEDLKEAVPEVEYLNFYATGYELPWGHPETFQVGEVVHKLEGSRAGEDFFKMFSYPVIAGNPETALKDKSSLAISRKMAALFFESPEDAIGKSIRYENVSDFIVTAVFENVSSQSSLKFDYLLNWDYHLGRPDGWASHAILATIKITENADPENVEDNINRFLEPRLNKNNPAKIELGLQPFGDRYLISNFVNGRPQGGRIEYVKIFSLVAILILLVACINFMNLATARSVKQAKEVGVRKVAGSSRSHLIGQFIGESVLTSFLALLLSGILLLLLLPGFNILTGKQISLPINESNFWFGVTGLLLTTGFFAGSYPALYLSSLRPARVLKGVIRFTKSAIWFRKGLVVFQFGISILLLIATIVISWQTNYVQDKHLGYNRENLISIRIEGELNNKYAVFKERLSKMPGIAMVDRSSETPHAMGFVVDSPIKWEGKEENASVGFKPSSVGFDFLKIMDLQIAEGRDFSREYATDTTAFMINETALKQMGMKDPIGKWISAWQKKGHIIAILKDYHTHSLHEPIKPIIIDVKEDLYFGVILIRTQPGKTREALASLEKVHKEINPAYPLAYQFIDQEYEKLYKSEQVISQLSSVFATLAVIISCMGLLGLAMFSAEQRSKEIGIRKVLGASVNSLIALFSKDFLQLVGISFIVAAPVSWFFVNKWLQGFAYRVDLAWWIFALTGLLALAIALLTVSFQAIKTSLANPVKALRAE